MKKIMLLSPLVLGLVLGVLLFAPKAAYANHVCDEGTPRAGQAIPHVARQAENFCYGGGVTPQEEAAASTLEVDCNADSLNTQNCGIVKYVVMFIRILSASVGVVVVIMVAWGGFQYTTARDNPQQAASAKEHIRDALIALLLYIFIVAFLNYIVPGGVF